MKYYLNINHPFGIEAENKTQFSKAYQELQDLEVTRLTDWKLVSGEEYDNTILDLRYIDGEWQQ